MVQLGVLHLLVGSNSPAAIDGAAAVSEFHFFVTGGARSAIVIVIVDGHAGVVALDEPAAGRVIPGRGERQAGAVRQGKDGLHQSFSKAGFAYDESAVGVLDGAGHNLRSRCGPAVHQHHQRIIFALIAVPRVERLGGLRASALRDDHRSLLQEFVSHAYGLIEQPAGISPQVKDQAFEFAETRERVRYFTAGRCMEAMEVYVADAGSDLKCQVHRVARDLIADYAKLHGVFGAFAGDGDNDLRSFWTP